MWKSKANAEREYRTLVKIINELKDLKTQCLPEEKELVVKVPSTMEQKQKQLSHLLLSIEEEIDRLEKLKSQSRGESHAVYLRISSSLEVRKRIAEANMLWKELMKLLQNAQKNSSSSSNETELDTLQKQLSLYGESLKQLTIRIGSKSFQMSPEDLEIEQRRERYRKSQDEKRNQHRQQRQTKNGKPDIALEDFHPIGPQTAAEEQWTIQVYKNIEEQDEILDDISRGLDALKEMSNDIHIQLDTQSELIHKVDEKMDQNIDQMKTANRVMKHMLEEHGGMVRWCTVIVCLCLLCSLIGYILSQT